MRLTAHAQALDHADRSLVGGIQARKDAVKAKGAKSLSQGQRNGLGGIAMAGMGRVKDIAHLGLARCGAGQLEQGLPQQAAIAAAHYGKAPCVAVLRQALGQRIACELGLQCGGFLRRIGIQVTVDGRLAVVLGVGLEIAGLKGAQL
jgi:hypothetical protein